MQTIKKPVQHKGQNVAEVEIPVYANLDEMITSLTPEKVLNLASRQLQADIMNTKRAEFRPAPEGKTDLRNKAMAWASTNDPDGLMAAIATNDIRQIQKFLDDIIAAQNITA